MQLLINFDLTLNTSCLLSVKTAQTEKKIKKCIQVQLQSKINHDKNTKFSKIAKF